LLESQMKELELEVLNNKRAKDTAIDFDEEKRKGERSLKQTHKQREEEALRQIEEEGRRETERLKRELEQVKK